MTNETYNPPADQIAKLVVTRTPEQLAIAYLRAVRRAKSAEAAMDLMAYLPAAETAMKIGDIKGGINSLKSAHTAAEKLPKKKTTNMDLPQ